MARACFGDAGDDEIAVPMDFLIAKVAVDPSAVSAAMVLSTSIFHCGLTLPVYASFCFEGQVTIARPANTLVCEEAECTSARRPS